MRHNRRRTIALAAGLLAGTLAAGAVLAEDVWVKSESAEIRSGKGAVFPLVAKAEKGAQLTVISREPKGWIKVKVGDKEGYVYENSISPQQVKGGGNLFSAMGAGVEASNLSAGAAGKGLEPQAEDYAKGKRLDPGPMNWLIAFRKKIVPKEWAAFTAEGKVGPDAP
ncbi:MAG: SH3 domain-containing protein [Planctomycetota bacterium]|nr:SH3 domain-containing protein [Planctomycetota bacterium]